MSAQTISKIPSFKSDSNVVQFDTGGRYIPPVPDDYYEDSFVMMAPDRREEKRARSQERWNKAGVIASCTIAASLLLSGLGLLFGAKAIGKFGGKNAQDAFTTARVAWEDFKGAKTVADLDSGTTSISLKDALNKIIKASKLTDKAREWGGSTADKIDIIYLYGHGGVGKTYVAKQYAQKIDAMFTCIKYPDLGSPYKDAASMKISNLFDQIIETAEKNKERKIVVCIDEIDAVMRKVNDTAHGAEEAAKSRAAVLTGLDKIKEKCSNVTVIATSNYHPQNGIIDPIALRRFNNKIEVPLPNNEQIGSLLEMYLHDIGAIKEKNLSVKSEFKSFIKSLEKDGYSNGEIELIAKEASKIFSSTLDGVADSELSKHPFKVEYLEQAKKILGEPASKTNKLMEVNNKDPKQNSGKQGFWRKFFTGLAYAFNGGRA